MRHIRFSSILYALVCGLVLLLAACGSGGGTGNGGTPTATAGSPTGQQGSPTSTSTPRQTQNVPPTQTSCPAAGSGRALVTAYLARGTHPSLVYVYNVGSPAHPGTSFLKRFDATSGTKTTIATLSNAYVTDAQVSADGQWILFVTFSGGLAKLQAVRLDGQGLQTLYCAAPAGTAYVGSALINPQWSTDQRHVIFGQDGGAATQLSLLDIRSGSVQQVFSDQGSSYMPLTWLDNTRVYLVHQPTDAPADSLFLLDTSRGANQTANDLRIIYKQNVDANHYQCWNADSSYDGTMAFVAECTAPISTQRPGQSAVEGPSRIIWMSSVGNQPQAIYTNSVGAITSIRAVTSANLLFTVDSQAFQQGVNVDTSQNGLWKVGTNGAGATRLTTLAGNLNLTSQFPWSNVSRDGGLYSLQVSGSNTQSLYYGSMSGGAPTMFAATASGSTSDLNVAGWTLL